MGVHDDGLGDGLGEIKRDAALHLRKPAQEFIAVIGGIGRLLDVAPGHLLHHRRHSVGSDKGGRDRRLTDGRVLDQHFGPAADGIGISKLIVGAVVLVPYVEGVSVLFQRGDVI